MTRHRNVLSMILLAVLSGIAIAQDKDSLGISLFPGSSAFRVPAADGTGHRFGVAREIGSRIIRTSIGGSIAVVEISALGSTIQLGTGASVHTLLDPGKTISVVSTDYYVDFFLVDILLAKGVISRVGMGHTSHHLGEEEVLLLGEPTDYSRDYAQALLSVAPPETGARIYAGGSYAYTFVIHNRINKPWLLQGGVEYVADLTRPWPQVFGAIDVKVRQESGFGSTQRYVVGLEHAISDQRNLRLELIHQRGLEDRGQFTGRRRAWTSVAAAFEF